MKEFDVKQTVNYLCSLGERDLQWKLAVFYSGDHMSHNRQDIMSELAGKKIPVVKSGINAIANTIMATPLWKVGERCRILKLEDHQDYMVFRKGEWVLMRFHLREPEAGFNPNFRNDFETLYCAGDTLIEFKDRFNQPQTI